MAATKDNILNRYVSMVEKGGAVHRPNLASSAETLKEAQRWQRDVVRDIGNLVTEIQDPLLPEQRIRDLNDEINRLLRTKHHWDKRVEELGGAKVKSKSKSALKGGIAVKGSHYYYFGAAKNLPGVKELFQAQEDEAAARAATKTRGQLYRGIDGDYYGFRDDEDGAMAAAERAAEAKLRAMAVAAASSTTGTPTTATTTSTATAAAAAAPIADMEIEVQDPSHYSFDAHARRQPYASAQYDVTTDTFATVAASIPSLDQAQAAVLAYRKAEVLAQFS